MSHAYPKALRISISVFAMLFFPVLAEAGNHKQRSAVSFDYPGAIDTQATAITPSGDIVGR